mmetsp:Transcript_1265/g.3110  ORF Transcript_1265/g.3110 Transcript_1265/m.3110 type:complete len:88 (+) Transcript_1265:2620-2883(+)
MFVLDRVLSALTFPQLKNISNMLCRTKTSFPHCAPFPPRGFLLLGSNLCSLFLFVSRLSIPVPSISRLRSISIEVIELSLLLNKALL